MKEVFEIEKKNTEVVIQAEQKKEIKFIGSQRQVKGLKLWQFNTVTKELTLAKFRGVMLNYPTASTNPRFNKGNLLPKETERITKRVDIKDHCVYIQALNEVNAKKKLIKQGYLK